MGNLKEKLLKICSIDSGIMSLFIQLLEKKGYTSRDFIGEKDADIYEELQKVSKSSKYYSPKSFVVLENENSKGIVIMENDGVTFRAWNNGSKKICFGMKAGYPDSKSDDRGSLLVRYAIENGTVFDERCIVRKDSKIDWLSFSKYLPGTIISRMQTVSDFEPCEPTYNLSVLPSEMEVIIPSSCVPNGDISPAALVDPEALTRYAKYSPCYMSSVLPQSYGKK